MRGFMISMRTKKILPTAFVFFFLAVGLYAQSGRPTPTPPPKDDDTERVFTEEIKLNVLAFDDDGKFASGVQKEDLVITENNVLHQASSIRRIPANVLIVMDTGGEMRQIKSINQTRNTAKAIVSSLKEGDTVAVLQYHDRAEIIAEWTSDKAAVLNILDTKTNFGKRSVFVGALSLATDFLQKNPLDNKHLVLITDGTDSLATETEKAAAMRKLLSTDINVHVISYTKMETTDIEPRTKGVSNSPPPRAMPPEIAATLPNGVRDIATAPKIGPTINLDRAMLKKMRERKQDLITSEKALSNLAENTNGEFILPETKEEMLEKSALVARIIDSSYVVTYVPKRPLSESRTSEERNIEVSSKRSGLQIQARRKLIIGESK
ncbi:MAG: VWA domain-containing protein [Acidobacteriota bacterium]|nr:VWA domain-containing protein [Acidobacteriota bacterium]